MLEQGAGAPLLGPGALVLVVGPSGAGKDTLIAHARRRLYGDPRFHFPKRTITRPAEPELEDNDTASEAEFRAKLAGGHFALHWSAHGLLYGIPAEADRIIAAGGVVVVNVSRGIVRKARQRYANVLVVRVVAPPMVLAERLSRRGRESDAQIEQRLARLPQDADPGECVDIVNDGPVEQAGDALVAVLVQRLISGSIRAGAGAKAGADRHR